MTDTAELEEAFNERAALLDNWGVEYTRNTEWRGEVPNRTEHLLPSFSQVRLPFSPEEWCALCMRTSDYYVGGCCSTSAVVQDLYNACFRDGGYLDCDTLAYIADLWVSHGDSEWKALGTAQFSKRIQPITDFDFNQMAPEETICAIWQAVSWCYVPPINLVSTWKFSDSPEVAFNSLSNEVFSISMDAIFATGQHVVDPKQKAMVAHGLAVVRDFIDADFSWTGFVLYNFDKSGILQNDTGLMLYDTKEEAEEHLDKYRRYYKSLAHPEFLHALKIDEVVETRRVTITKKGLKVLPK